LGWVTHRGPFQPRPFCVIGAGKAPGLLAPLGHRFPVVLEACAWLQEQLLAPSCCLLRSGCFQCAKPRRKRALRGCFGLRGASFLLLVLSAGCPQLLSLNTSHRFNTLGEILLKIRNGVQPSSPPPPLSPGEQEWYFLYVKTCHFSELIYVFRGTLAETPAPCWLHLLLTSSLFPLKS